VKRGSGLKLVQTALAGLGLASLFATVVHAVLHMVPSTSMMVST
jgi:hypothetical protein